MHTYIHVVLIVRYDGKEEVQRVRAEHIGEAYFWARKVLKEGDYIRSIVQTDEMV